MSVTTGHASTESSCFPPPETEPEMYEAAVLYAGKVLCLDLKVFLSRGDKLSSKSNNPASPVMILTPNVFASEFVLKSFVILLICSVKTWNIHPAPGRAGPGAVGGGPESAVRARLEHSILYTQLSRGLRLREWRLSANILIRERADWHH